MSIVKELNDLAEKMTGENPKNKTIGKALDYIEQNYSTGGGGSGETTDVYYINYEIHFYYNLQLPYSLFLTILNIFQYLILKLLTLYLDFFLFDI